MSEPRRRRQQVAQWMRRQGINADRVLHQPGHLTVRPVNEGWLEVTYLQVADDKNGKPILCRRSPAYPHGLLTFKAVTRTDVAPPGFRLPEWDAHAWSVGDYDREDQS